MIENRQHNNPWAEKLSQVSLPDGGASWIAMEALLDKKMPTDWRRDRRRWLLLTLLLLLLIGVCNCPGRRWFSAVRTGSGSFRAVPQGGTAASGPSPAGNIAPPLSVPPASAPPVTTPDGARPDVTTPPVKTPHVITPPAITPGAGTKPAPAAGSSTNTELPAPVTGRYSQSRLHHPRRGVSLADRPSRQKGSPPTSSRKGNVPEGNVPQRAAPKGTTAKGAAPKDATPEGADPQGKSSQNANSPHATPNTATPNTTAPHAGAGQSAPPKKNDSLAGPAPRKPIPKDGAHKKPPAPPIEGKKTERYDGWMAGIGLNQFFRVGGQQASSFNSSGITGTLSDYIPVPMIRYYFNPKLYVQLETQINTPQYTKKNLVAVSTPVDSIGATITGAAITVQKTVSINKLFYFNIPLSVHYMVLDHLDLGAGLQYSRLTNGIGVFNSDYNTAGNDSLSTETKSVKGDSAYKEIKTQEFRFLVDANYTWQHFIFGIRYNQALSRFIHVEISPGQVTQARNSSLQIYLRYILWDGRKKKPLLPAK